MLFILQRYNTALKILMYFLVMSFFITSVEGAPCNCCPPPSSPPVIPIIPIITVPPSVKPTLPNDCETWFPMPTEDSLVVLIQIYDTYITEHDHDCDGIIDSLDTDVDKNGIVVVKDSVHIQKGEAVYIDVLANDSDVDVGGYIDKDTLVIFNQPLHGTLHVVNGKVYYLPDNQYIGEDKFTYVVKDNEGMRSKPTSVSIHIKELNRAPIAQGKSLKTKEDTPVSIRLIGSDIDHDSLTYKVIDKPSHGILLGTAPHLRYTPKANFFGKDSFTFKVYDGKLNSLLAKVIIQVLPVNDNPIANDDNISTNEGKLVSLKPLVNDIDTDGNTSKLRIVSITQPHYGIALLEGNGVHYTPKSNSATLDTLTYTIEDEDGGKDTATIKVNIISKNDAPIANEMTIETNEDQAISFELSGTDPDGDNINYTLVYTQYVPEHGAISGNVPNLIYTPDANYTGEDYIVFQVDDGELESFMAVVKIIVHPLNDPPIAIAGDDVMAKRGDSIVLDGSASYDVDGNITSYEWKEENVILSTEEFFSHVFYDEGVHTVTLTVTDEHNTTDSDEKIITINPCCEGCNYPDPTQTNPFN